MTVLKVHTEYKIRDKATGLWSPGGSDAHKVEWSKGAGKTWNSLGALKNHLNQFVHVRTWEGGKLLPTPIVKNEIPDTWEVVPIRVEYTETPGTAVSAKTLTRR